MIKLTLDARVLAMLKQAMPKTNKAELALEKYVNVLESMFDRALLSADDNKYRFFKQFTISTHQLMLATGQVRINGEKTYLHKWLEENQLALIKVVEVGLKGAQSSIARLTPLVTLDESDQAGSLEKLSVSQLTRYLNDKTLGNDEFFNRIFPDFLSLNAKTVRSQYDRVDIDIYSLKQYIFWLLHKATKFNVVEKAKNLKTAQTILRIAQFTGDFLPQQKTSNFFGRNYYSGISVQSVHKSLRQAMMGNCWEYDIRSSVISWKMGFAQMLLRHEKSKNLVSDEFGASIYYLSNKQEFTDYIRNHAFDSSNNGDIEFQNKTIKEALTAISFGARMYQHGWIDMSGKAFNPAIVSIIADATIRKQFIGCDLVQLFRDEQKRLDRFIFDHFMAKDKSLSKHTELQTASGRVSKSKVLAYLYQHAETQVMNVVRSELKKIHHEVIANVHDAIFTRDRIRLKDKKHIEQRMCKRTKNLFWALKEDRLKRYAGISDELKKDELAHQQRIAAEELHAKNYKPKHF